MFHLVCGALIWQSKVMNVLLYWVIYIYIYNFNIFWRLGGLKNPRKLLITKQGLFIVYNQTCQGRTCQNKYWSIFTVAISTIDHLNLLGLSSIKCGRAFPLSQQAQVQRLNYFWPKRNSGVIGNTCVNLNVSRQNGCCKKKFYCAG